MRRDGLHNGAGLVSGFHVVHTQYVGAVQQGVGVQHGGAVERRLRCAVQEFVNHRLARDAYQQRAVQCAEVVEVRHQFVVMLQCFAEAEAGVGYYVGHAHLVQAVNAFGQVQEHLAFPEALRLLAAGRLSVEGRRVRIAK